MEPVFERPDPDRTARLAASYANTSEGVAALRGAVDIDRIYRHCDDLKLTLPNHVRAVPNEAVLELSVHSPALNRTVAFILPIAQPTELAATAGDRYGPQLRPVDVAGYLAVPESPTLQMMTDVRGQLAVAAITMSRAAERLQATENDPARRLAVADSGPWRPGPAAIDALSALLEQDARWKAQMMINQWYVNAVRAAERGQVLPANTGVQISSDGIRVTKTDPAHLLPDDLRELLNEHWRGVYVRTVHEQLGIIDSLSTPGEQAMLDYLEAREDRDARRRAAEGFPEQPGTSNPPPPSSRPDDTGRDDRENGAGR